MQSMGSSAQDTKSASHHPHCCTKVAASLRCNILPDAAHEHVWRDGACFQKNKKSGLPKPLHPREGRVMRWLRQHGHGQQHLRTPSAGWGVQQWFILKHHTPQRALQRRWRHGQVLVIRCKDNWTHLYCRTGSQRDAPPRLQHQTRQAMSERARACSFSSSLRDDSDSSLTILSRIRFQFVETKQCLGTSFSIANLIQRQ